MSKIDIVNKEIIQSYLITTAKYSFSVDEKRVLTAIISSLQDLLEGQKLVGKIERDIFDNVHIIAPMKEYIKEEKQNYKRVKEAFFSLNEKKFIYQDENIEEIIRLVEMPKAHKRGEIEYTLNPKIVDCFLNFNKGYTKYQLSISLSLNSVYSMRLYELVSNQQNPITFKIDTLKEMFCLSTKYKYNKDFINKVIIAAQTELNEKSPWTFNFDIIKKGKRFDAIRFIPIYQPQHEDDNIKYTNAKRQVSLMWIITDKELRDYLKNTCSFTDRELKNNAALLERAAQMYGEAILDKIREIQGRARTAKNPKGYIINAIKQIVKEETI